MKNLEQKIKPNILTRIKKFGISKILPFAFCSAIGLTGLIGCDSKSKAIPDEHIPCYALLYQTRNNPTQEDVEICKIDEEGNESKLVTCSLEGWGGNPVWSPEGVKIAYTSDTGSEKWISTIDNDGSNIKDLVRGLCPTWSPDGKKIAFVKTQWESPTSCGLYIMNPDGSNIEKLVDNVATYVKYPRADWSPDGTKLLFVKKITDNEEICVVNTDGSKETNLTNYFHDDWFPSWSPDGTKIAFESYRNESRGIYVMDADGSNQTELANNPPSNRFASWSPDGTKIAFIGIDSGYNLYVMDSDGSNQTKLSDSVGDNECIPYPNWSPDGTKLSFISEDDGMGIYTINIDGTDKKKLTSGLYYDSPPSWSPTKQ